MDAAEVVFATARALVPGLAATFGPDCEIVLHDYRDPAHSVVAVAGDVTGRRVGDGMSEIGARLLAAGDAAEPELNYVTRTPDGRHLKSTTIPLRDPDGGLLGALCVNVDVTALTRAASALARLAGVAESAAPEPPVTHFTPDVSALVDEVVARHERDARVPARAFDRPTRLEALRDLVAAGVFERRGAAAVVAPRLAISRAGLYNDLRTVKEDPDAASD